jgi:hypothetical protein
MVFKKYQSARRHVEITFQSQVLSSLPSRGTALTTLGEETRSRTRAGAAHRTRGWL